jgi:hypothetical protein
LDPRKFPEPVPRLPEELGHLDDRRDGNEQREDLDDVSFLIKTPFMREYLAKTKGERVVRCAVSAKLYNSDPIPHRERDDRHKLDKWVVIPNRSPKPKISIKIPQKRKRLTKLLRYGGGTVRPVARSPVSF